MDSSNNDVYNMTSYLTSREQNINIDGTKLEPCLCVVCHTEGRTSNVFWYYGICI